MKRIFSMLAVLAILFVISVPLFAVSVSAAETETDELAGTWIFNETLVFSNVKNTYQVNGTYHSLDEDKQLIEVEFNSIERDFYGSNSWVSVSASTFVFNSYYTSDSSLSLTGDIRVQYTSNFDRRISNTDAKFVSLRTFKITSKLDEVSNGDQLLTWLKANARKVVPCDGSTCPATDLNMDNICDDCGNTFSVLRDYTPSDFPSNYPPVPSLGNPNARYYLYRVISSNITYIVAYPSTVTPTYDSTKQNGQLYFSESYGNYRLDKTNWEWVLSSDESPYTIGGNNSTSVENLYSSVQIKDEKGENFFPIPLWEKVQEVTQREIPSLRSIVLGTIQILLLCGVGLMVSLMVLNLFGKVFKTYRH